MHSWTVKMGIPQKKEEDNRLILLYKGLKGKASVPTDDLIPKTRLVEISTLWHFRLPLLIQIFIKVVSSPRLGIGMLSPILWSHLLKMQRIVLLSSLLWWELGTNSVITGPGEWLLFRHFPSNLSWSLSLEPPDEVSGMCSAPQWTCWQCLVLAIAMISKYHNTVFGSCHETLNSCLLRSTDLQSTKSSDRTDFVSSSGSFILHITWHLDCPFLTGGSIVDSLIGKSGANRDSL